MTGAFEGVSIALESLRSNKARAALTILGVAIGVVVVMVIAAMISGINRSVSNIFESIAPRTFLVWRWFQAGVNVSDGSDESSPWRRNPAISDAEADRVATLPSVRFVTRREETQATVEFGDVRLESVNVSGLSAQWVEVNGGDVYPGRTFSRLEDMANSPVAVINRKLEDQLFRGRDPIGQTIHIAGSPFTVINMYTPPPNLFSKSTPPFIGLPHGVYEQRKRLNAVANERRKHQLSRKTCVQFLHAYTFDEDTAFIKENSHILAANKKRYIELLEKLDNAA